jgi:hypothetical protein
MIDKDEYDAVLREQVARSFVKLGNSFLEAAQDDSAMDSFNEVIQRFGSSANPRLVGWTLRAFAAKATYLETRGLGSEAIRVYDHVVAVLTTLEDPDLIVRRLHAKGDRARLVARERMLGAVDANNEVLREARLVPDPRVRITVATAQLWKGISLAIDGRQTESKVTLHELINEHADSKEPSVLKCVENARSALRELG